ncbi:AAA family ATPase [Lignipirellula cremea]|uniref:AAA family ATPase n=1 Tax=Lignipirellula cremea TaxID=2528010 RepID=UPI0037049B2E
MTLSTAADTTLRAKIDDLRNNLCSVIRGKSEVVELVLTALFAGGSVLIEDVPGVGKTTLAKALAASVELKFQRVQCTPDLLPADIFGFSVYNPQEGVFRFRSGPIFTNILLLDEINRASPRTQSALLEAMAEGQVTIEGELRKLEAPFLVIATQNPVGHHGTFPLPESQLDRFLLQLTMEYPDPKSEMEILYSQTSAHPLHALKTVLTHDELIDCQERVKSIHVAENVAAYLVAIVGRTRTDSRLKLGCSPRGSLQLFRAAQAIAFLHNRDFVLPDDVQKAATPVLAHRLSSARSAHASTAAKREIVADIVSQVNVPV